MKIVISGWSGCGSTTLSLILAKKLNYKLYRGSESFRLLLQKLEFQQTGESFIEGKDLIQPYWGPIYDKFVDRVLLDPTRSNLIIESDIAAFRVGKKEGLISIFLHGSKASRLKHFSTDDRKDDGDIINEVDEQLKKEYMDLYNVDFFDLDEIRKKYNFVIDNSNLTIAKELEEIYTELFVRDIISKPDYDKLMEESEAEDKYYWEKGKDDYKKYLTENDLIYPGILIIKDILELFPSEIEKFPLPLRNAVKSFKD